MVPAGITAQNFERGMLIDDEWMAGVAKEAEGFSVFVVDHATGAVIAQQSFRELEEAISALNQIPRAWKYEATGGCAGDRCAEGKCKGTGCKIFTGSSPVGVSSCS